MGKAEDWKWKVEDAVDTLIRAEEIKNDKKLFTAVKAKFQEKMRAMQEAALELKVAKKQTAIRNR